MNAQSYFPQLEDSKVRGHRLKEKDLKGISGATFFVQRVILTWNMQPRDLLCFSVLYSSDEFYTSAYLEQHNGCWIIIRLIFIPLMHFCSSPMELNWSV